MTTKPKAKKFRIRRNGPAASPAQALRSAASNPAAVNPAAADPAVSNAQAAAQPPRRPAEARPITPPQHPPQNPGRPAEAPAPRSTSGQSGKMPAGQGAVDDVISAIRREGLTGRQLRIARRNAQKNKLPATSDFDAVRLLREAGIDPFGRSNMLSQVVQLNTAQPDGSIPAPGSVQLPQTVPAAKTALPSTELSPAERRNLEIAEIQKGIAKRRRRKLVALLGRLAFFVGLPTLITGYYFHAVATPMFATKSEFLILTSDGAGGSVGGLLSGTQFATSQDSIAVQGFLQSKDAMLRLDRDVGFKSHFTQDWIDPIQRLNPSPSNEEAYKTYSSNVKIGYDPTEGVIRMEVSAADPAISAEFSKRLISYAEDRVNSLSLKKRDDQMKDALSSLELAEVQRREAQAALVKLQQQGAILDPEGVIASLRSQISNFEIQLQERELELAALLDNSRPNKAKVAGARADITRLENLIERLNQRMISASAGENSLASLSVKIQMSQADLATRDLMLQSALQQVEQTRMEANRQVRYLTTSVEPVPSDEPSYPRKFENTLLAFLIFSGIYLMISLTASILREQVSS